MADKDFRILSEVEHQHSGEDIGAVFSLGDHNEALGKPLSTDDRVPGRLLGMNIKYERLGAEEQIIRTLKWGYKLQFEEEPPASFVKNLEERGHFVKCSGFVQPSDLVQESESRLQTEDQLAPQARILR